MTDDYKYKRHKYSDLYERLVNSLDPLSSEAANALDELARQVDNQTYRIAELKAALKPFADKADKAEGPFEPPYPVDYSLWRAARAAYLGEKE
jgi:hypothetical protein